MNNQTNLRVRAGRSQNVWCSNDVNDCVWHLTAIIELCNRSVADLCQAPAAQQCIRVCRVYYMLLIILESFQLCWQILPVCVCLWLHSVLHDLPSICHVYLGVILPRGLCWCLCARVCVCVWFLTAGSRKAVVWFTAMRGRDQSLSRPFITQYSINTLYPANRSSVHVKTHTHTRTHKRWLIYGKALKSYVYDLQSSVSHKA